ncbi:MAG: sugar phosphate isomerase/epimerase [Candidatus Latescibacteria bacterium]|nr:sugar phosphate isomerase/epimerase [Candidatus Latescibacterota bacterium]
MNWYGVEAQWNEDLGWLRRYASLARDIGALRTTVVVLPFSDELTYEENYRFHIDRLRPCADVLQEYGCALGLEFIGPKTLRTRKYDFLYTMAEALKIGSEIGGNVGLLLDLWHLYTSHGSNEDVRRLSGNQVVSVHVNDAPAGVAVDEQIDSIRCLPGETGVLDIADFLEALRVIGYDGPVTAEPFSKRVNEMPQTEALVATSASMTQAWMAAGLA